MKRLNLLTALFFLTSTTLLAQERIATADFTKIEIKDAFNVVLVPSDKCEIVLPESLKDKNVFTVYNSSRTLVISLPECYQENYSSESQKEEIFVYFKSLEALKLSGTARVRSEETIEKDLFRIILLDASSANLDIAANIIASKVRGTSTLSLTGPAESRIF